MRYIGSWLAGIAALGLSVAADAQPGSGLRQRIAGGPQAAMPPAEDLAFGSDPLQHLDFWRATDSTRAAPLVVFVHGGGWKRGDKSNATGATKIAHFRASGYAVASVDYRLVPAHRVEDQADDIARAVALLIARAPQLGIDPQRIVLMGHSAGAHLAALVGTDPHFFASAGLKPDAVKGVVLLDGAAYDVPRQIAEGGRLMHATYLEVFGTDPVRQRSLSPTAFAPAPNAPRFLILHIDRDDGTTQSQALGAALRAAGTPAEVRDVGGTGLRGHMAINRDLGSPGYAGTPIVDAFLSEVFALPLLDEHK